MNPPFFVVGGKEADTNIEREKEIDAFAIVYQHIQRHLPSSPSSPIKNQSSPNKHQASQSITKHHQQKRTKHQSPRGRSRCHEVPKRDR
jgi:hypothetical protein